MLKLCHLMKQFNASRWADMINQLPLQQAKQAFVFTFKLTRFLDESNLKSNTDKVEIILIWIRLLRLKYFVDSLFHVTCIISPRSSLQFFFFFFLDASKNFTSYEQFFNQVKNLPFISCLFVVVEKPLLLLVWFLTKIWANWLISPPL